ncbi:hypothetical protein [Calidithermus roseus]|uniref:Uncharacterized protein n=1 Tax=Calidithermus roseus TaxID=1644118 RepID=A0A399EGA9_9DEIN|nr:hypothetical protein [Calidithermus roseus]RIH81282.1 hypothetical protein Mrose_03596 [Calidithermus roseus]
MGITHYWRVRPEALEQALPAVARDLAALRPYLPPLQGRGRGEEAVLQPDLVYFNGLEPADYEDFVLTPRDHTEDGRIFGFCKTGFVEQRPYGRAVMAALALLKWHCPEAAVNSDLLVADWDEPCRLVVRQLGYPVDPFWVLEREAWRLRDGGGREFLAEGERDPQHMLIWLDDLARQGALPLQPPFRVVGPADGFAERRPHPHIRSVYLL